VFHIGVDVTAINVNRNNSSANRQCCILTRTVSRVLSRPVNDLRNKKAKTSSGLPDPLVPSDKNKEIKRLKTLFCVR